MIYKNVEIFNVEEIINNEDGSISWLRVPENVFHNLESGEQGKRMAKGSTGVEIRFVLKGEKAVIKMCTSVGKGRFHVYRGGIQGGWQDHEANKSVDENVEEFEILKSENPQRLKIMSDKQNHGWDSEVIRILFDSGMFKIFDITGDIELPEKSQVPDKTLICYGSSITHGSNALDISHSWPSVLGYNIGVDVRNLGMAGSCFMEPDFVEYIARDGEKGNWDIAILELGVNVMNWEEDKFRERIKNTIIQIAGRNEDKPVFVISPFYLCDDDFDEHCKAALWRTIIGESVNELGFSNVTYINGLDLLGDMSLISADQVHPNIYGVAQIAERITKIIRRVV